MPNAAPASAAPKQARLLGYPVAHSLSPVMHNAAFATLGIAAEYRLWEVPPDGLAAAVRDLRRPEYLGANVTMPHKERVLALVDEVSPLAERAGAVNTIVKRGERLRGENTDVGGFLWPLRAGGAEFTRWRAAILGAGGAARGVAVALLDAGVSHLAIVNRTRERAEALVATLADPRVEAIGLREGRVGAVLAVADLLVNATAAGWHPDEPPPLSPELLGQLPAHALVYDLTYRRTSLLAAAAARGLATLDGLPMLVEQGALALQFWTGREAPREVMWEAARAARDRG